MLSCRYLGKKEQEPEKGSDGGDSTTTTPCSMTQTCECDKTLTSSTTSLHKEGCEDQPDNSEPDDHHREQVISPDGSEVVIYDKNMPGIDLADIEADSAIECGSSVISSVNDEDEDGDDDGDVGDDGDNGDDQEEGGDQEEKGPVFEEELLPLSLPHEEETIESKSGGLNMNAGSSFKCMPLSFVINLKHRRGYS